MADLENYALGQAQRNPMVEPKTRRSGWLSNHLEHFVRPHLGFVPKLPKERTPYFSTAEMTVIKNAWRSVKKNADGRTIILPGRDVFIFEVLARREGHPTVFIPECSRLTVNKIGAYRDAFVLDTGFLGTIPKGLNCQFSLLSYTKRDSLQQVFPKLTLSRSLALRIEATPKYWRRGFIDKDGGVKQDYSEAGEFEGAAMLTIEVYKDSSPKFIPEKCPLTRGAKISW